MQGSHVNGKDIHPKTTETGPDYYLEEDDFFGSKQKRISFTLHAEEVMLHAYSQNMKTHDYTDMSIELQGLLKDHVLQDELFCFSGYHHSVMLLSALASRLHRGPREHLFIDLHGENGLARTKGYAGQTANDVVSDTLVRIDAVQKYFSESHSFRIFSKLKKLFPLVLKYMPPREIVARHINNSIRPPKGFTYEGCHFGIQSPKLASFDAQSRFFNDDMHIRSLSVDDNLVTRWQTKSDGRDWKRDYFVLLNVGLRLRRGTRVMHYHVPIRILSFAVRSYATRWIQPKIVTLPRINGHIYSATMYTLFVYFMSSFNSMQLLLAGAVGVLYLLEEISLRIIDTHLCENKLVELFERRMAKDRLSAVQVAMVMNKFKYMSAQHTKLVRRGMRHTADALMASAVLETHSVYRTNFISPETIEGQ